MANMAQGSSEKVVLVTAFLCILSTIVQMMEKEESPLPIGVLLQGVAE